MGKQWKRAIGLAVAVLIGVSLLTAPVSQAAVPRLDTIRVAMFLQLPGKYTETTNTATFTSTGGLQISVREPDKDSGWFEIGGSTAASFAIDNYKAKLFESSVFADAQAVYKQIKATGGAPFLHAVSKKGTIVYQVTEGSYSTAAEASAAINRFSSDASIAAMTSGFTAAVHGPHYLEAGPYGSQNDSVTAAKQFGALGVDAFPSIRKDAEGLLYYSVMLGGTANEAELAVVQAAVSSAVSGITLKPADTAVPYLLIRDEHATSGRADVSAPQYFYAMNGMKLLVSPSSDQPITFKERSGRTYRGSFELSVYNNRMAVINELPFEHYLYSVVGGEMVSTWPAEALKAQAVAARSYALNKGFGFQIAHVVDTTLSQVYHGIGAERASTIAAVDATAGEVAMYNGKVIEALFASNAGGKTADASEIWNNAIDYLVSVDSPDHVSEAGLYSWYRVVLPSGAIGYIRMDLLNRTGYQTESGAAIMEVNTEGTRVRRYPLIQDSVALVDQLNAGAAVVVIGEVKQTNAMSWIRGPYTSDQLLAAINARLTAPITGPIESLEVTKTGPSGRVTEVSVNGVPIPISYPDAFRSTLGVEGSLPSTLFQIEQTANVAVLGAGGAQYTKQGGQALHVIGASGKTAQGSDSYMYVMDAAGDIRPTTKQSSYAFVGTGNGHGIGLSQYGALGLAQQGYDYQYILKHYYKDIIIAKE